MTTPLTWGGDRTIDTAAVEPAVAECCDGASEQGVVAAVAFSHALVADPFIPATETVIAAVEGLSDIILAGHVPSAHSLLVFVVPAVTLTRR